MITYKIVRTTFAESHLESLLVNPYQEWLNANFAISDPVGMLRDDYRRVKEENAKLRKEIAELRLK
jgi:hypothetical protein